MKKTKKRKEEKEMILRYQDQEFCFKVEDIRKICFKIGDKTFESDTIILYAQLDPHRNIYKRLANYTLDNNIVVQLDNFDGTCREDKRYTGEVYRYRLVVTNKLLFSSLRKYHYLVDFYLPNKLFHLTYRKSKE